MKVDILDYLGKHDNGILVSLTLNFNNEYYQCIFFYDNDFIALTPDDKLEELIGCEIEDWENYTDLVYLILSKILPYEEAINIVSDFKPDDYNIFLDNKK
jgi:hypothetical protein